jgi:hypothetical protein
VKYLLIEKSKRVSVKPYQRKGKFVIGYTREDPRNKNEFIETPWKMNLARYVDARSKGPFALGIFEAKAIHKEEVERAVKEGKPVPQEVLKEYKLGEPFRVEIGTAFVGVPQDFVNFIEKVIPRNELEGLKSIEEFSFQNFMECKTIPKEPYLNYLEKAHKKHPDWAGMYFQDIRALVLDKTDIEFEKSPSYKKYAFLHEIGHHQWWYHTTAQERKEFVELWEKERIGAVVVDMKTSAKLKVLETPETTQKDYKVKNVETGEETFINWDNVLGMPGVSRYSSANANEGFAEAYAEYRIGTLPVDEFPDMYDFFFRTFDKKRIEKKQNVLVEHFAKS